MHAWKHRFTLSCGRFLNVNREVWTLFNVGSRPVGWFSKYSSVMIRELCCSVVILAIPDYRSQWAEGGTRNILIDEVVEII